MDSTLDFWWSGFEPLPGTLCCVFGQGTLLSQSLSSLRYINRYECEFIQGATLRWTSMPSREEYKYS